MVMKNSAEIDGTLFEIKSILISLKNSLKHDLPIYSPLQYILKKNVNTYFKFLSVTTYLQFNQKTNQNVTPCTEFQIKATYMIDAASKSLDSTTAAQMFKATYCVPRMYYSGFQKFFMI